MHGVWNISQVWPGMVSNQNISFILDSRLYASFSAILLWSPLSNMCLLKISQKGHLILIFIVSIYVASFTFISHFSWFWCSVYFSLYPCLAFLFANHTWVGCSLFQPSSPSMNPFPYIADALFKSHKRTVYRSSF